MLKTLRPLRTLIALAVVASLPAAAAPSQDEATLAAIKQTLSQRFKDVPIVDVKPSTMPGLYEVFTGTAIAYSDRTGDHLFVGSLVDTATGRNLSAERVAERNSIDFDSLPFNQAIKVVRGTGERKLAIFADPDCPFCQKLEKDMQRLENVTVYTFLYPIPALHPEAMDKAHAIWCSSDRGSSWTKWMTQQKMPETQTACDSDPIASLQSLAKKLNITGTPTMYLANGRRLDGTIDVAKLETLLTEAAKSKQASTKPASTASR